MRPHDDEIVRAYSAGIIIQMTYRSWYRISTSCRTGAHLAAAPGYPPILGLPLAVRVDPASPHDVEVGRELVADSLPGLPRVQAILADRGYRGLARLAARKNVKLDIKAPPPGTKGFTPIAPLYKVEHAFARLGRWRRLSRCYEGTEASARAWLEVAAVAYMFARIRVEPT